MTYLLLFWEFFKTGLFSVGGGYATLPFLADISTRYGWYSHEQLTNFIAISEVTPGPIGINVATFAGYVTGGIFGGVIASAAVVLPAVIIILCLCRFFPDFRENKWVKRGFYGLLPVAVGLIAATGFAIFKIALLSHGSPSATAAAWILLLLLLALSYPKLPFKVSPFVLLFIGGLWGYLFL